MIGLFDSGVGGLTVLRAARACLPQARWVYLADAGFAPYGERSDAYVRARALWCAQFLIQKHHCQVVGVACNTATAVAIATLRARWPHVSFVGCEPGVKPAVAASCTRRVAVLATPATLRHPRYQALVHAHAGAAQVLAVPCPGLAAAIEGADEAPATLQRLLDEYAGQVRALQVDTVVLGCTHYAWVHAQLAQRLGPGVRLMDTAQAVARQLARYGRAQGAGDGEAPLPNADIMLWTTGDPARLQSMAQRWLGGSFPVQAHAGTDVDD